MATSTQEALWVLRAQCGDREALELLLMTVEASLRRYLRGLAGGNDAEDILQSVLILIYRRLTWLQDPLLFRPWAFRIASREALRWLRKRARRQEEALDESMLAEIPSPEAHPSADLLAELHRADSVSPASRAVLVLHFQEGLTLNEVAAILGIPLGTAKSRLAYGLVALRRHVGHERRR